MPGSVARKFMSEVSVYIVQPCRENTCHLFSSIPSGLSHSDRCFLDPCQFTFCTANENTELLTGPKVNAQFISAQLPSLKSDPE